MKKSLVLLPLLAAGLSLSSCAFFDNVKALFKKDKGETQTTGDNDEDTVVLDFTDPYWKDEKVTPYVKNNTELYTFTYEDIVYNDKGCFANSYNDTYFLMMKNKWTDGKAEEGEEFAFFGNADSYGKEIKSIDVEVSVQTGAVNFLIAFGDEAFETCPTTGTKKVASSSTAATYKISNKSGGEYFAIAATVTTGNYRKNGGLAKVTIHF